MVAPQHHRCRWLVVPLALAFLPGCSGCPREAKMPFAPLPSGSLDGANCFAFAPDARSLVYWGAGHALTLRDLASGKEEVVHQGQKDDMGALVIAFSPDGKTVATGHPDSTSRLWDLGGKASRPLTRQRTAVRALAFAPDGKSLVSATGTIQYVGCDLKVWDVATGKAGTGRVLPAAGGLTFTPGGKAVAVGALGKVLLLDPERLADRSTLEAPNAEGAIEPVAFAPDGATAAGADAEGVVTAWDAASGRVLAALKGHRGPVQALVFSPDGRLLASGGDDKSVRLWDPRTGKERHVLAGHATQVKALSFTPDGDLLSVSFDKEVKRWDVREGKEKARPRP